MAGEAAPSWDPAAIVRGSPIRPWSGNVWRCHSRKYRGDDPGGSLKTTGRFHRGADRFSVNETWPALYTGLALHIALGERLRHTTPASLSQFANQRISRLHLELHSVLILCAPSGCADISVDGLDLHALCNPVDFNWCHQLALAARDVAEAMLIPSCTRFPEGNLVIFPDRLEPHSSMVVEETQDPDLFVDWALV